MPLVVVDPCGPFWMYVARLGQSGVRNTTSDFSSRLQIRLSSSAPSSYNRQYAGFGHEQAEAAPGIVEVSLFDCWLGHRQPSNARRWWV